MPDCWLHVTLRRCLRRAGYGANDSHVARAEAADPRDRDYYKDYHERDKPRSAAKEVRYIQNPNQNSAVPFLLQICSAPEIRIQFSHACGLGAAEVHTVYVADHDHFVIQALEGVKETLHGMKETLTGVKEVRGRVG